MRDVIVVWPTWNLSLPPEDYLGEKL